MDLASFIPGITNTANFTPGSTTPPPFNVAHVGMTDGSGPSTSSKNMAEVYNRVMLNIAATVVRSGLTLDNNNWAQLPTAVERIAQNVLSGFTGTIVTPPIFDSTSKIATTQFVQRALGNMSSVLGVSANPANLDYDVAGRALVMLDTAAVVNINPTGMANGSVVTLIGNETNNVTVNIVGGAQLKPSGMFTSPTSLLLRKKTQVQVVFDGGNLFAMNAGPFGMGDSMNGDFGYLTLENGLMFQWGVDGVAIGETTRVVPFNTSFATGGCMSVMLVGKNNGVTNNNNVPQLVSMSGSTFTYFNQGIVEPSQALVPNQGIGWFAIGRAP